MLPFNFLNFFLLLLFDSARHPPVNPIISMPRYAIKIFESLNVVKSWKNQWKGLGCIVKCSESQQLKSLPHWLLFEAAPAKRTSSFSG